MPRIVCPYCVTGQDFNPNKTKCANCSRDVPRPFIEAAMVKDPVWTVTVGAPRVGKTTYVDSLAVTMKAIGKVARGVAMPYYDEFTMNKMREIRNEMQQGNIRGRTDKHEKAQPLLLGVPKFMGNEENPLVLYDFAGEIFDESISQVSSYAPALAQANTIWYFVSIADMRNDSAGREISDALQHYLHGMNQLNVSPKGRNLLIIFTKADKIRDELPTEVKNYVVNDPYQQLQVMKRRDAEVRKFDADTYYEKMLEISEELYDFCYENDGYDLINLAEQYELNLRFAITSAIGGDTTATQQMGSVNPYRHRVIDPLIFAIKGNQSKTVEKQVALVVDSTQPAINDLFGGGMVKSLHSALGGRNVDIVTYHLGNDTVQAGAGQTPDSVPLRPNLPLIGPILDQLNEHSHVIVLTQSTIPDLDDFRHSSWDERLYLVTTRELAMEWSYKVEFNAMHHDVYAIVDEFYREMPIN